MTWASVGRIEMALQLFSELELQHGLTVGFLEIAQLSFVLLGDILRIGLQSILHAHLGILLPLLDLLVG